MKTRVICSVLALLVLGLVAADAGAADNTNAKWALHIAGPVGPPADCEFDLISCDDIVVEQAAIPGIYTVVVLVTDFEYIQSGRFGICCEGAIDVIDAESCADWEDPSPGWPACGEGLSLSGPTGAPGPDVTAAILTVQVNGPSRLSLCPDPRVGYAELCDGGTPEQCFRTDNPAYFGSVGFDMPGYNPCGMDIPSGIEAIVRFDPRTLNLKSEGTYVGCTVELPDEYDTTEIDDATVMLNGIVHAMTGTPEGGGNKRYFKFDRGEVQALFCASHGGATGTSAMGGGPPIGHGAQFALHVAGELYSGEAFAGRDTSRVIHQDDCEDITLEFSPPELDFGIVPVGDSSDLTVTIVNTGDTPVIGTVTESSPDFDVVAGGGPYLIAPDNVLHVVVRFSPTSCGTKECTIDIGHGLGIHCSGEPGPLSECEASPTFLDLGAAGKGVTLSGSFQIENTGCGPISGTVTESCAEFSIVPGTESYSLDAGETHTVQVTFQSTQCGSYICLFHTGCGDVEIMATVSEQSCDISPPTLDFGYVDIGASADLSFVLTNDGCNTLDVNITENCDEFSIVSGMGFDSLLPGTSITVTVRFEPESCGTKTCTIETGNSECSAVQCTGTAESSGCTTPSSFVWFGVVDIGSYLDKTFSFSNSGCALLNGTVSEDCNDYSIVSGGGNYSLAPGESRSVTVRFQPTTVGLHVCQVDLGNMACSDVELQGEAWQANCDISPQSLWFGAVDQGTVVEKTFTITNNGNTTLTGTVEEQAPPCSSFDVVSGGGAYTLQPGMSKTVTVKFNPTECDSITCKIETSCGDVTCTGVGTGAGCWTDVTTWDFGGVQVGSSADKVITVQNVGCTVMSLDIKESCNHFEIVSGGGPKSLLPNESTTYTVRFAPTATGTHSCFVEVGGTCSLVNVQGTGTAATSALQVFSDNTVSGVRIDYWLKSDGPVRLQVYDAAGRLVRTLVRDQKGAGEHSITWDRKSENGRPVNAGIYFIKLNQDGQTLVKKAMVLK